MGRSCTACARSLMYTRNGSSYSHEEIRVEPGVYDGGLYLSCPFCGHRRHRWPVGSALWAKARPYVEQLDAA